MIGTDADVVSGDSGGPLLDAEGEVIGIDTATSSGAEIDGYAIPIDRALDVVEQILAGQESATVQVGAGGYLGVSVSGPVTYGSPYGPDASGSAGAVVAGVVVDAPAAELGLAAGDVVTAEGSTAISSGSELSETLAGYDAGETVEITWTDAVGRQHTGSVALAASPVA